MMNNTAQLKKKITAGGLIVGLALMASYFGAGNIVIPPSIGFAAGTQWMPAILAFLISGILFPAIVFIAVVKSGGTYYSLFEPLGGKAAKTVAFCMIVPLMPLLGIPRLVAVAYEIGFSVFVKDVPVMLFSFVFLLLSCLLALNPSKFIDIIGKFLTPFLIISLAIIVIKAVVSPIGSPKELGITAPSAFGTSLLTGYATGDATASLIFAGSFMMVIREKIRAAAEGLDLTDIDRRNSERKMTTIMITTSCILLAFVYGGMCYMGATGSGVLEPGLEQTALTIALVEKLMGTIGLYVLSFAVLCACFTTSIGVVGSISQFIREMFPKIPYKWAVIILCVISFVFSKLSVASILYIVIILNSVTAPMVMILAIVAFLRGVLPENSIRPLTRGMIYSEALLELVLIIGTLTGKTLLPWLPLRTIGFEWLIPSAIIGIICMLLFQKKALTEKNV